MAVRLTLNGRPYTSRHNNSIHHDRHGPLPARAQPAGPPAAGPVRGGPVPLPGARDVEAPEGGDRRRRVAAALAELDHLVGLGHVKALIYELHAFAEIQQRRREANLAAEPLVMHMTFRGNPGTGKTTVARILARILKEMGVLSRGHLVEVERADLVGEYIGHTAQKTRSQIQKALGGVLFIDEAYSLARGGEKDFGREAIDTLVRALEQHRENLVCILAGYRAEMEWFLLQNPGLRSRFPIHLDFPDYTHDELLAIAEVMLARRQYRLTADARARLAAYLRDLPERGRRDAGNARTVRNLIERALRRQAVRLVQGPYQPGREELMAITAADVEAALRDEGPPAQPPLYN
ncbi:MAG: AAA family ATPase [Thermaerobacter sp.]